MVPSAPDRPISELLVAEGLVEMRHVQEALAVQKQQGGHIVDILIHRGYLRSQDVAKLMSESGRLASFDLGRYEIPNDLAELVPREFAQNHLVFPIDKMGRLLTIGMAYPLDGETIHQLESTTGLRVKALLCNSTDIRNAIDRYYKTAQMRGDEKLKSLLERDVEFRRVTATARLASISGLIRDIDVLPALPQTVQKVQEALEDPDVPLDALADIIAQDPLVSAKLLRLVNSAVYSLSKRVDNIRMAVKLLGLRETSVTVLSSSVVNVIEKSKHFDFNAFWQEAVFAARAAKIIVAESGKKPPSGISAGAVLHDIGRFALSEAASVRYSRIDKHLVGTALLEAEEAEFSLAHPEAGYILATHWGLPDDIAEVIRFHHAPHLAKAYPLEALVVALASHMAELFSARVQPDDSHFASIQGVLLLLDLDTPTALRIYAECTAAIESK